MRRKIVQQGAGTMTISLPSAWVQRFSLQPGDMVDVTAQDRSVIISTEKHVKSPSAQVDIRKRSASYVWRKLLGLYRAGVDSIEVKHANQFELVSRIANSRIGLGIVEHTPERIVIQDLAGVGEVDFDVIYRRCFRLLQEQCRAAKEMVQEGRDLRELETMDYSLNQMTDYCLRYLSKRGHEEFSKTHLYYHIINEIEYMGDILTRLKHTRIESSEETADFVATIEQLIYEFHHAAFNSDEESAEKLIDRCRALREQYASSEEPPIITLLQMVSVVKNTFNSVLSLRLSA